MKGRLLLLALWILSLVGISYYGGPVSYGFFAAMTLLPAVCLLYNLLVLLRFKIYQTLDKQHVVAGSVSKFYITLQNEDFYTYAGIRIRFFSPFSTVLGMDEETEYELAPFSGIEKETSLLCKYRGEYEVGIRSILIRDPLKLFTITFRNKEPYRIVVCPAIIRIDTLKSIDETLLAARDSLDHPTEPDALVRRYEPGDDIRRIHWKQTASAGKLLVRKTVGEEKNSVCILMDPKRCKEDPGDYLPTENKLCEISIALTVFFEDHDIPVRILTYHGHLQSHLISGSRDFGVFYDYLSGYSFDGDHSMDAMLLSAAASLQQERLVLFVLQEISGAVVETVSHLRSCGATAVLYLVSDDKDAADRARALFPHNLFVIPTESDLKEVL
ncbi:MAG: DUF58 domain-containing protein [Lachnospiraceae bacterium]|nr:DUF58 domain-containing protein [Lachnospiraceae bacterium]